MSAEIVERVRRSARYRDVDPTMLARLAAEELPRARNVDDAVKRVKRRLHQAVGAFRGRRLAAGDARPGSDVADDALAAMARHASTRERLPFLDAFYAGIWAITGRPRTVVDLGCGLHPLGLPRMGIDPARYGAYDVDGRVVEAVGAFFAASGQAWRAEVRDLVTDVPREQADVAFLLKLVTTLDRQDPRAGGRLLASLESRHAVVSFAARSLGGRGGGRQATYRARMERLVAEAGRVEAIAEVSIPTELIWVLTLGPPRG